ncbi:MAG: hypothetical protein KTR31_33380 [Myxococcales bacterium]|nr:hypothetical protein [Myxococcales bacterium]
MSQGGWWGDHQTPAGTQRHWEIGSLDLWVERQALQWSVAHAHRPDAVERYAALGPEPGLPMPGGAVAARFATGSGADQLSLRPVGADRPIVVRPDPALGLAPGRQITFYVGTTVWVSVVGGGHALLEVPVLRPSDTWFGPSVREGALCYASRTRARLELAELPEVPGRAVTQVTVRNDGANLLHIERVQIPSPQLGIYQMSNGKLWTQSITVLRQRGQPLAEVRVASGPPAEAGTVVKKSPARSKGVSWVVVRALGQWLS